MPYIRPESREAFDEWLGRGPGFLKMSAGELNYVITTLCLCWLNGAVGYANYNDVVGVLETTKLEFYRRALAPYEDEKRKSNGDVY